MYVQTRYCPNCGKPLAFLPSRNRYFCNYCRLPFDAEGPVADERAPGGPDGSVSGKGAVLQGDEELPEDLAATLPAEPPREVILYAPVTDLNPVVRRSSLLKGTVEAMAEDEARRAVQTGDYIILSKAGRCAIVAARKTFGEATIVPRALDTPGVPWRFQISSNAATVEVGLFKAPSSRPPSRMPQPAGMAAADFYVASLALKGPAAELSGFVSSLVGLLEEAPWASRFWGSLAQALNLPASKLLIDWKQYLDYSAARVAAFDVASARKAVEDARGDGFPAGEPIPAMAQAISALSKGDHDAAKASCREVRRQMADFMQMMQKLSGMREAASAAIAKIREIDPHSGQAADLEREVMAQPGGTLRTVDSEIQRVSEVLGRAAFQLFSIHVEKASTYLSTLQGEAPDLSKELRVQLQGELERGRRLLESGNVQGGADVLERAISSMKSQADGHFAELAVQTLDQARSSLEDLKNSRAEGAATWGMLQDGLEEAQRLLDEGRSAEAGRMAQKILKQIEDGLEASSPQITVSITGPPLTAGGWNRVVMKMANTGTADARNLAVTMDGPIELMALDEIEVLKAGAVYNDNIGVRSDSPGTVPVKLVVECNRAPDDRSYHFESELWLEFRQALDLSGAKNITIDRSVHIVDSVLNRSTVGGEDALEGIPQQGAEDEADGKGRLSVQDSVINRSGRRGGPEPALLETKCPNCGRMISTEWKRCPYCS
jgi:hypothetical protein